MRSKQPWVADQALEIAVYAHSQATESSAPFDLPHYLSTYHHFITANQSTLGYNRKQPN